MKEEQLRKGIKVCHTKHNTMYVVLSSNMRMKDSVKDWEDAVIYAPLYDNVYDSFCRDKQTFLKEFEVVEG